MRRDPTGEQWRRERCATPDRETAGEVVGIDRLSLVTEGSRACHWLQPTLEAWNRAHDGRAGLERPNPWTVIAEQRDAGIRIERADRQHWKAVGPARLSIAIRPR